MKKFYNLWARNFCWFCHALSKMANFHSQISMTLTMNRILLVLTNLIVLNCVAIKCTNDFSRNLGSSQRKRSTENILDTGQLVRYIFIASFIEHVVYNFTKLVVKFPSSFVITRDDETVTGHQTHFPQYFNRKPRRSWYLSYASNHMLIMYA